MTTPETIDSLQPHTQRGTHWWPLPFLLLLALEGCWLLIDAILPLQGLAFHTALLTSLQSWSTLPTRLLFPGWSLTPTLFSNTAFTQPANSTGWLATGLLFGAFLLLFLFYLVALRVLPQLVTRRYVLIATLLFSLPCLLAPVLTSQDLFSYIMYARMQILYHLNPLVSTPVAIQHDPLYQHLYWKDQPSAYGPAWLILTGVPQWLASLLPIDQVTFMVLALRVMSLLAHVGSTILIWCISGPLVKTIRNGDRRRLVITMAFAWNPLLLFEAGVNAHNDTIMLFFLLLALWAFVRAVDPTTRFTRCGIIVSALLLAWACCIKLNLLLLLPGLLLYLWHHPLRWRNLMLFLASFVLAVLALYLPFWAGKDSLGILHENPGTYRAINTLADVVTRLGNSLLDLLGIPMPENGSPIEQGARLSSMLIAGILYLLLCWRAFRRPAALQSPWQLFCWLALAWLLYCALGTPWFWPWYTVTFFGLFALVEAGLPTSLIGLPGTRFSLQVSLAARLLAWSMLGLNCLFAWVPYATMVPLLPDFRWAFLRGAWAWLLPLLALTRTSRHTTLKRPAECQPDSLDENVYSNGKTTPTVQM